MQICILFNINKLDLFAFHSNRCPKKSFVKLLIEFWNWIWHEYLFSFVFSEALASLAKASLRLWYFMIYWKLYSNDCECCFVHPIFSSFCFWYFGHFSCVIFFQFFFRLAHLALQKCKHFHIFVTSLPKVTKNQTKIGKNKSCEEEKNNSIHIFLET